MNKNTYKFRIEKLLDKSLDMVEARVDCGDVIAISYLEAINTFSNILDRLNKKKINK